MIYYFSYFLLDKLYFSHSVYCTFCLKYSWCNHQFSFLLFTNTASVYLSKLYIIHINLHYYKVKNDIYEHQYFIAGKRQLIVIPKISQSVFKTHIRSNQLSADFVTKKQISLRKKASLLMVSIADEVKEGNKR